MRCWAEGLDLVDSWHRYQPAQGAADARQARGELQRLLDQLRGLALAQGRRDVAVLLRRDPEAIPESSTPAVSLDEFRARQPPDFYSEAELVELYRAEHGALPSRSAGRRKQRLRTRLLAALQWLERTSSRPPTPADAVGAWLDERVARRLGAVGIVSLGDLRSWVRRKGLHWHRSVPRLGPEGAKRILRWLGEHQASLGPLPPTTGTRQEGPDPAAPAPPARTGIVPLERFILPAGLDGAQGSNRAAPDPGALDAANDLEAVHAWLAERPAGTHTWRAYRKEAERFLLWAVVHRRKALSSLGGDDCAAYRDFLAAPGPAWAGPRHAPRSSEAWRPFEGPLGGQSRRLALVVVRSLCQWLVQQRYLAANPWDRVGAQAPSAGAPALRALDDHQWALVQAWLEHEGRASPSPALCRLRFVMEFAVLTGLRLSELVSCRVSWLQQALPAGGQAAWSLQVPGRPGTARQIPLPERAIAALQDYLASRALSTALLANPPDTPLVAHLGRNAPLSAARLYEVLAHGFERCAAEWLGRDRQAAETIREASAHWLRHTHGSLALGRGVPPSAVRAHMGHQSAAMTALYVRAGKERLATTSETSQTPQEAAGPAAGCAPS